MELNQARDIALKLITQMAPYCSRIEIAGSIRREKPEVKDVEIVAIPRWDERPAMGNLFNPEMESINTLHEWALRSTTRDLVTWIKPATSETIPWMPKEEGKYWRGLLNGSIKLDLFLCTPKNWGAVYLIRTGSADFSHAVAAHAQRMGRNFKDGFLTMSGIPVDTFEEATVFDLLELCYVEPADRRDGRAVVPLNRWRHGTTGGKKVVDFAGGGRFA